MNNESNSLSASPSTLFIYHFPLIFPVLRRWRRVESNKCLFLSPWAHQPCLHSPFLATSCLSPAHGKPVTHQDTAVIGTIKEPGGPDPNHSRDTSWFLWLLLLLLLLFVRSVKCDGNGGLFPRVTPTAQRRKNPNAAYNFNMSSDAWSQVQNLCSK